MNISTTAIQPTSTAQPQSNQPQSNSANALLDKAGQLDFSQILKELDLDGDGQISDQEFDAYRSAKAARGEFVATDGPTNTSTSTQKTTSDVTETLFRDVMEKRQSSS